MLHSPMQFCTLLRLFCCEGSGQQSCGKALCKEEERLAFRKRSLAAKREGFSLQEKRSLSSLPGQVTLFSIHLSTVFVKGEVEFRSCELPSASGLHSPFPGRFGLLVSGLYNIRYEPRSVKSDCEINPKPLSHGG